MAYHCRRFWRGVRVAEGARLESVYTVTPYRGFESLSLRQILKNRPRGGFLVFAEVSGFDENPPVRQNGRIAVLHRTPVRPEGRRP